MRYLLVAAILVLGTCSLHAQGSYSLGMMPVLNLNHKYENGWRLNLKLESRQRFLQGEFQNEGEADYEYVLTDLAALGAKKVGLSSTLAGGYLIRFRDHGFVHRLIQQYSVVQEPRGLRLVHRIVTDQTFQENSTPELRLRYRFTLELPLSGQTVNPGEAYFKINHEYLNALEADIYGLEVRWIPLLGFLFTDTNKLEGGVDYRLDDFLEGPGRNRFWVNVAWYVAF
ncbi:MAG: DUF2490 domain-containing protein [Bacteroidota bacterium]